MLLPVGQHLLEHVGFSPGQTALEVAQVRRQQLGLFLAHRDHQGLHDVEEKHIAVADVAAFATAGNGIAATTATATAATTGTAATAAGTCHCPRASASAVDSGPAGVAAAGHGLSAAEDGLALPPGAVGRLAG